MFVVFYIATKSILKFLTFSGCLEKSYYSRGSGRGYNIYCLSFIEGVAFNCMRTPRGYSPFSSVLRHRWLGWASQTDVHCFLFHVYPLAMPLAGGFPFLSFLQNLVPRSA